MNITGIHLIPTRQALAEERGKDGKQGTAEEKHDKIEKDI